LHRSEDSRSPLEEARARLGLTLTDIGKRLGCSEAAVSRYLSGERTPPPALYFVLASPALQAQHEAWLEATGKRRGRGAVDITVTCKLPRGLTIEEAKQRCAQALAEFVAGAAR
jgi:transcriptional regulator with XRE-family HTH domain